MLVVHKSEREQDFQQITGSLKCYNKLVCFISFGLSNLEFNVDVP